MDDLDCQDVFESLKSTDSDYRYQKLVTMIKDYGDVIQERYEKEQQIQNFSKEKEEVRKLLLEMNDEFLSLIESIHELKQLMESNTYTNFFHDLTKWYDGLNDDRAIRDMVRG